MRRSQQILLQQPKPDVVVLGKKMEELRSEIHFAKKEIAIINNNRNTTKQQVQAYCGLWGADALRMLGKTKYDEWEDPYRYYNRQLYFRDIKYRSALRKARDKVAALENEYKNMFSQIKECKAPVKIMRNNRLFY